MEREKNKGAGVVNSDADSWESLSTPSPETAQSATERLVALVQEQTEEEKREKRMSPELIAAYGDIARQNEKLAQENESGRFKGVSAESWGDLARTCERSIERDLSYLMFDSGEGTGIAYDCINDDILAVTNPDKLKARFAKNPDITDENFDEAQEAYYHIRDLHRFAVKYDGSGSLIDGALDGVLGAVMLDTQLRGHGYKLVGKWPRRHYETDARPLDEIKQGIKALEDKIKELKNEKQ